MTSRAVDLSPLSIFVELLQRPLHLVVVLLRLFQRGLYVLQTLVVVQLIVCPRLILVRAEMLDLLATVLDLRETESGGGSFEKVA